MKKGIVLLSLLSLSVLGASGALAAEDPIENAMEACKPKIETYCTQAMEDVELKVLD